MGALLSLRAVRHERGGRDVLRIDELALEPGRRLGVLGANGAGKTTLLRLLAGLDTPTEGEVEAPKPPALAYALQRPTLVSTTAQRNVELPLRFHGLPRHARHAPARAALRRLQAEHLADRRARSLSHGEAQRVSLARALVTDPAVLLLDEPAAALDALTRNRFLSDLDDALDRGRLTVVHVSHRPEDLLPRSDQILVLIDGEPRQLAAPEELLARPGDATVAQLLGYDNVLPVDVAPDGQVMLAGRPTNLRSDKPPGPATLAAWATAIELAPPTPEGLTATVIATHAGPGRHDLTLDAGARITAHLPLTARLPAPRTSVSVQLDPMQTVVL